MYERFTDNARKVMQLANQEAQRFNHEYVGTEHVLLGLVKEGSGVAANLLKGLDVDLRKIRVEVEKIVQSDPGMVIMGKLSTSPRAKKVIEYAIEEARNLNHNYVGTEHLLLGLLREQEGVAAQVLMNLDLKLEEVREEVLDLVGRGEPPAPVRSKTPALDSFGRDLTDLAGQGKLDPVVGRDELYERLFPLLVRGCVTHPLLVGEPGVGKTSVVAGMAQRIASGDVPEHLRDCKVVEVDPLMLMGGSKGGDTLENRLLACFTEAARAQAILFIDDVHLLGRGGGGTSVTTATAASRNPLPNLDLESGLLADWLRSSLAKGRFRCLGATTARDDRDRLSGTPLGSVFRRMTVPPLSGADVARALAGVRGRFEAEQGLIVPDDAMEAVASWSTSRAPGALALSEARLALDFAAMGVRLRDARASAGAQEFDEAIESLRAERERAQQADDLDRVADIASRIENLSNKRTKLIKAVADVEILRDLPDALERLGQDKEEAIADQDFERAAALREQVDLLKGRLDAAKRRKFADVGSLLDRSALVGILAGSSVASLPWAVGGPAPERLAGLEAALAGRVFGQAEAVEAVARVIREGRPGASADGGRPWRFVFAGPRRAGMSRLADTLAGFLLGDGAPTEVNLASSSGQDAVDRAFAALFDRALPIDGDAAGPARRWPAGVLVLDRFEAAVEAVRGLALRALTLGRLESRAGRSLDLRDAALILTVAGEVGDDGTAEGVAPILAALDRLSAGAEGPPGVPRWVEHLVPFRALGPGDLGAILGARLEELGGRLAGRGVALVVSDGVRRELAAEACEPAPDVDLLHRVVDVRLERRLAGIMLREAGRPGYTVRVDLQAGGGVTRGLTFATGGADPLAEGGVG